MKNNKRNIIMNFLFKTVEKIIIPSFIGHIIIKLKFN